MIFDHFFTNHGQFHRNGSIADISMGDADISMGDAHR
jgi:hypothetical protein